MCIAFFLVGDDSSPHKLILGGNRDEFFDRDSASLAQWPEAPQVWAGRDLVRGGTWLGVARGRRPGQFKCAVVHNYRHRGPPLQDALSRGELVLEFLKGAVSAEEHVRDVETRALRYNGFTLLVVDESGAYFASNRPVQSRKLAPGVYGLSNATLDTPWPKLQAGKRAFGKLLHTLQSLDARRAARIMIDRVLKDPTRYPHDLPGVLDEKREECLSSIFVEPYEWDSSGLYGTRTHSVCVIQRDGEFCLVEETLDPKSNTWTLSEAEQQFRAKL